MKKIYTAPLAKKHLVHGKFDMLQGAFIGGSVRTDTSVMGTKDRTGIDDDADVDFWSTGK